MNTILLIAGIQGFILGAALISKKNFLERKSNRYFLLMICSVSLYLFLISRLGSFENNPKLFLINYLLVYLYTPLYFFYITTLIKSDTKEFLNKWWTLIPVIVYTLLLGPYLLMSNDQIMVKAVIGMRELLLADILAIIINFIMLVRCFKLINASSEIRSKVIALSIFQISLLIINALWLLALLGYLGVFEAAIPITFNTVFLLMSAFIFLIGYFIILNNELLELKKVKASRYNKVKLGDSEVRDIGKRMIQFLEENHPYLNPDFKLSDLEDELAVSRFKLSYTLSNHLKTNFKSLVNKYRIGYFLKLIESKKFDHFNTVGVANESGFKSKSTFYKAFKDCKGVSPKEYFDPIKPNDLKASKRGV